MIIKRYELFSIIALVSPKFQYMSMNVFKLQYMKSLSIGVFFILVYIYEECFNDYVLVCI